MGPRSFNRGKLPKWLIDKGMEEALQWGLGLSTEESTNLLGWRFCGIFASMGPRSFNRGKVAVTRRALPDGKSFNGASVFQPRKVWADSRHHETLFCFNGASVFQPRKALVERPNLTLRRRFNGASVFQPRKDHPIFGNSRRPLRFNGASVFQPRKGTPLHPFRPTLPSFNGASVFQPRKAASMQATTSLRFSLQWGLGLSTEERLQRLGARHTSRRRFNGASVFQPRKGSCHSRYRICRHRFNGASVFQPRKAGWGWVAGLSAS